MPVQRLAAVDAEARNAIADSWGAAHAAARYVSRATTRHLPIAALRLDMEIVRGLRVLGFERVGELLDQPHAPLPLRFGNRLAPRPGIGCVGRTERPFHSVDDLWRRAGVPSATLAELAEADAFRPSMGLARHEALWAIKALRDEPLPLFAAAATSEAAPVAEQVEPSVQLRPMTAGSEVVEDYSHVGLTLRDHPVSFLRADPTRLRLLERAHFAGLRRKPGHAPRCT